MGRKDDVDLIIYDVGPNVVPWKMGQFCLYSHFLRNAGLVCPFFSARFFRRSVVSCSVDS